MTSDRARTAVATIPAPATHRGAEQSPRSRAVASIDDTLRRLAEEAQTRTARLAELAPELEAAEAAAPPIEPAQAAPSMDAVKRAFIR